MMREVSHVCSDSDSDQSWTLNPSAIPLLIVILDCLVGISTGTSY